MSTFGCINKRLSSVKNRWLKYSNSGLPNFLLDSSHMFYLERKKKQKAFYTDYVWISLGILLSLSFPSFLTLHCIIWWTKKGGEENDTAFWWISLILSFMFQNLPTLLNDSCNGLGSKTTFSMSIIPKMENNLGSRCKQPWNRICKTLRKESSLS